MAKTKAPALSKHKKMQIGKYAQNNPGQKMTDICKLFDCTYNQVVHAIKQYRAGLLHKNKPRVKVSNVEVLVTENTPEAMILSQFHRAIAQLEADPKIATDDRINLLDKLIGMRKTLQAIKIESHIKKLDIGIIRLMVMKFKPDITDDEIILLYKEAFETWKNQ